MFGKIMALIFVVMWFRWTFPRLRVDQLMHFEWKFLMPVSLATVAVAAVLATGGWYFFQEQASGQPGPTPPSITIKTQ